MTQYFEPEDGIIVSEVGNDLQFLDYLGVGEGLSEVRKLDQAYDSWYSEFHDKKSRIY
jgi:hypothetical protein